MRPRVLRLAPPDAPVDSWVVRSGPTTHGYFLGVGAARLFAACLIECSGLTPAARSLYNRLSPPGQIEAALALVARQRTGDL